MFTSKCYIKKYSFDLHDKLVEFGYTSTFATFGDIIAVDNGKITILPNNDYTINQLNTAGYIDCDNNDKLFLAIAALRDDNNDYQWFIWTDDTDDGDKWKQYIPVQHWENWWWFEVRKATVEELIEHFKK